MAKKKNLYGIISGSLFFLALLSLLIPFQVEQTSLLFPEKQDSGLIALENPAPFEGEEYKFKVTENKPLDDKCGDPSIRGIAVWINEKRAICQQGKTLLESSGAIKDAFVCETKTITNGDIKRDFTPIWGYDYGSSQVDLKARTSDEVIEGYAWIYQSPSTFCGDGIAEAVYFRINVNPQPLPCVLEAGQFLAKNDFGSGSIYSKETLSDFIKLCSITSTQIIDDKTRTVTVDDTIRTKLENNQQIQVPSGQIFTQFWVTKNPLANCQSNLIWDQNTEECLPVGTITYCSQGKYVNGACLVTTINQCSIDSDCTIPCEGMSSSCVQDGLQKKCEWSGQCKPVEEIKVVTKIEEKIIENEVVREIVVRETFGDFVLRNKLFLIPISLTFLSLISLVIYLIKKR